MSERDVRVVESFVRTGMSFEDLCDAFLQFPYEDIEVIFQKMRLEAGRLLHPVTASGK